MNNIELLKSWIAKAQISTVGVTQSGKKIGVFGDKHTHNYTKQDHRDAHEFHANKSNEHSEKLDNNHTFRNEMKSNLDYASTQHQLHFNAKEHFKKQPSSTPEIHQIKNHIDAVSHHQKQARLHHKEVG